MAFKLPEYHPPDFDRESFLSSPNVRIEEVLQEGVAPAEPLSSLNISR